MAKILVNIVVKLLYVLTHFLCRNQNDLHCNKGSDDKKWFLFGTQRPKKKPFLVSRIASVVAYEFCSQGRRQNRTLINGFVYWTPGHRLQSSALRERPRDSFRDTEKTNIVRRQSKTAFDLHSGV